MLATSLAFVAGTASAAQGAEPSARSFEIEEIVVTALKMETPLQKTPLAISVVSGDTLEKRGIDNVSDLLRATPGLNVQSQGTGQVRLIVRGAVSAGEEQTGLYYDETPIPGAPGTTNDAGQRMPDIGLLDVERIEVLRGPQGTLYGSGSMGGTVRALFNKPTSEFATRFSGGTRTSKDGDLGYEGSAMVNVPLGDEFALRTVAYYQDRGGYIDNVKLGLENVNEDKIAGGRLLMRYAPTENLTIDGAVHVQREDAFLSIWEQNAGAYRTEVPVQLPVTDDFELYNLTLKWDLGFATLTGVTSQFNRNLDARIDTTRFLNFIAPPHPPVFPGATALFGPTFLSQPMDIEDRSHELRLSSSPDRRFVWTVGGFFEQRDASTLSRQKSANAVTGQPAPVTPTPVAFERRIDDSLQQRAMFGEITYHVTPSLGLTVGGRYFDYTKKMVTETTVGSALPPIPKEGPKKFDSDEDGFVSKFGVSYQLTDRALLYAQASEGFRPGGPNQDVGLVTNLAPYESDSLWSYELGLKTSWLDQRVVLNLAAFRIDWDNMQVTGKTPNTAVSFISNAGAAEIDGAELEMAAFLAPGFEITLAGAYTDAKLSEDQINANVIAAGREGDRIPNVPEYSASFAADYSRALGANYQGSVRADFNYVGSSFSEFRPDNPFNERIDAYTLTNLRLRVESLASNWNVDLFVNNVFDKVAIGRVQSSAFGSGLTISSPPRTIGLNLAKSF
jgi:outer membrane receptor protein involved in Fe transport